MNFAAACELRPQIDMAKDGTATFIPAAPEVMTVWATDMSCDAKKE
jgi:hypothetical protein